MAVSKLSLSSGGGQSIGGAELGEPAWSGLSTNAEQPWLTALAILQSVAKPIPSMNPI